MKDRRNESRGWTDGVDQKQNPEYPGVASDSLRSGEDGQPPGIKASQGIGTQDVMASRNVAPWVNWQSALYLLVVGTICIFLAPLTSFWWIVSIGGTAMPIALAMLDRPGLRLRRPNHRKIRERELLHVLAEWGELTPATAAMQTSLPVDETSKMLEELARKGHLSPRAEDGFVAYTLRERHDLPGNTSAPSKAESESNEAPHPLGAPRRLDEPLSERELEVLALLASGRTNSEVARDLFVSVGTVKSHTGNIYRKLDAKNRAGALARARELNLLS